MQYVAGMLFFFWGGSQVAVYFSEELLAKMEMQKLEFDRVLTDLSADNAVSLLKRERDRQTLERIEARRTENVLSQLVNCSLHGPDQFNPFKNSIEPALRLRMNVLPATDGSARGVVELELFASLAVLLDQDMSLSVGTAITI